MTLDNAATHASKQVPVGAPDERVSDLRARLAGRRYDTVSLIVVCERERVVGVVRIEDLLAAPGPSRLADLMDREAPLAAPGTDQEVAAWQAMRNGESALTVVDSERRLVGVIPPFRLLEVLLSEHEEDLSRLGGFTKSVALVRKSSEEPVERRVQHRIPWLLVGLCGAIAAADLVGWFEATIRAHLVFTFFVPGIVYLADAVGTQTETVVVRGLSVGVPLRSMLGRELLAGLVIGLGLAVAAAPVIWWRWGNMDVAMAVSLAVLAACSTATIAAMALPAILSLFKFDPAFGSGPLATVLQDLSSIVIYFAIVTAFTQ